MAIGVNSLIEVTLVQKMYSQTCMNVWQYAVTVWPVPTSAVNAAEAWWNEVKTAYRALIVTGAGRVFDQVIVRELNAPTGDLAAWSIPVSEQDGTRSAGSLGAFLSSFTAVGVRLGVGSRATKPGQKRIVGLTEGDVTGQTIETGFSTLVATLMDNMTAPMTLGAPAALVGLDPVVTRKDSAGLVTAHQDITSYVINPYVTSQVSRKQGRGI